MRKFILFIFSSCLIFPSLAQYYGHYIPGAINIRDVEIPSPGIYVNWYNVYYGSNELADVSGNPITTVGPFGADVNADIFATLPWFLFSSPWSVGGIQYAASIFPGLETIGADSQFQSYFFKRTRAQDNIGLRDILFQPVILCKKFSDNRHSVSASYGFFAPTGEYNAARASNVGLGMWSHLFQVTSLWGLTKERSAVFSMIATYEKNGKKKGTNIDVGDYFLLEYGLSSFVSERFELGLAAFQMWAVTKDKEGGRPIAESDQARTNGLGFQISYVASPRAMISLRHLWETRVKLRLRGTLTGVTFGFVLQKIGEED